MGAKVQQKFTEPAAKTSAQRPQQGELDKLGQSEEKLRGEEVISIIPPTASLNLIRPGSLRHSLPPSWFSPITQTKQKQNAAASPGCTSTRWESSRPPAWTICGEIIGGLRRGFITSELLFK